MIDPSPAWQVEPLDQVVRRLLRSAGEPLDRPLVVAVDGSGASGKSTFAARLAGSVEHGGVVHTDDIAWHHAIMDWADLLVEGVLAPTHRGEPVQYRPPAWEQRERSGAVVVPAGTRLMVVEGVGAARAALAPWYDATVWVESDPVLARERGLVRDIAAMGFDRAAAEKNWDDWLVEETPFHAADRPWARATLLVHGTPELAHDTDAEVVVAWP